MPKKSTEKKKGEEKGGKKMAALSLFASLLSFRPPPFARFHRHGSTLRKRPRGVQRRGKKGESKREAEAGCEGANKDSGREAFRSETKTIAGGIKNK